MIVQELSSLGGGLCSCFHVKIIVMIQYIPFTFSLEICLWSNTTLLRSLSITSHWLPAGEHVYDPIYPLYFHFVNKIVIHDIPFTFSWKTCLWSNTVPLLLAGEHVHDPMILLTFTLKTCFRSNTFLLLSTGEYVYDPIHSFTFSWRTCLWSNIFPLFSAGEHVYDPIHFLYFQLENMFMI